jgi:hypothetical protein
MRAPDGDQAGWTASTSWIFRGVPPAGSTTQSVPCDSRCDGSMTRSVANTMCLPSGDQAGSNPKSVSRRDDSPVAPAMKIPPFPPASSYAMVCPSGEKAGAVSSRSGSPAATIGLRPPMRWT